MDLFCLVPVQLLSISFLLTFLLDGIRGQSCQSLDIPLYGSFLGPCLSTVGSTCSVRCNPSFEPLGSCARICQANGSWSGLPLICLNREISCPPLSLSNGVSLGGPCFNVAGGICRFTCPSGTTLFGSDLVYCTNMGTWSTTPPSCSPNGCPSLQPLENGQLNGICGVQETLSVISAGSTCTFNCNPGYQLIGSDRLVCLNTGQWSSSPPICQQSVRCAPLSSVVNGVMTGTCSTELILPSNTCKLSCNPGYVLVGQSLLICGNDGNWNSGLPSCVPVNCPALNYSGQDRSITYCVNSQGVQILNGFTSGTVCRISCPSCFTLNGPSTISCLSNGQWNGSIGACLPISCPPPTLSDSITVQGSCNYARCDDICMFTCSPGYEIQGSSSLTCGSNGQWNKPFPRCVNARCSDWSVPKGGLFINECPGGLNCPSLCPGIPNQSCILRCGAGYRLIGTTEEVICLPTTLQWSQTLPTCESIR